MPTLPVTRARTAYLPLMEQPAGITGSAENSTLRICWSRSRRKMLPATCNVPPSFTVAVAAKAGADIAEIRRRAEARREDRMAHHFNSRRTLSTAMRLFLAKPSNQQKGEGGDDDAQRQQDQ